MNTMMIRKRCGVVLGATAGLLALGALPTFAADAAPVEQPKVAVVAAKPVLPVVGGAKSLTAQEKADVDGAMRCARITFTTRYYVLGIEVYSTSEERWVCDPGVN